MLRCLPGNPGSRGREDPQWHIAARPSDFVMAESLHQTLEADARGKEAKYRSKGGERNP